LLSEAKSAEGAQPLEGKPPALVKGEIINKIP